MLSTLISLYKLLGTGDFVKVLLILLKGLSADAKPPFSLRKRDCLTGGLFFCLLTLLS